MTIAGMLRRINPEVVKRIIADAVMVNVALASAFGLRVLAELPPFWRQGQPLPPGFLSEVFSAALSLYSRAALALTPLCLAVFYLSGFYTYGRAYRSRYKALVILQAVTLSYVIFGAISYLLFRVVPWLPRSVWMTGWLLTLVLVGGMRLWFWLWRVTAWAETQMRGPTKRRSLHAVAVIGGAGYIGSLLVRKLLEHGYRVTVLDALLYGDDGVRELYGHERFRLIHDDLRDVEAVVKALQHADGVVHLGGFVGDPACALDEKLTTEINLVATRLIAEVALGFGIERFIFASTCSVYGASDQLLDEHAMLCPLSLYARTKLDSETVLLSLSREGFHPTILRFGTLYGLSPRPRFDLVVNLLAAEATCERHITIYGGAQWRPFIHVDDAASAIVTCLEAPLHSVTGQVLNVGREEENYRIAQLGELVCELMPDVRVDQRALDVDNRNYRVSFVKIRKQLEFVPRRSVKDGIAEIQEAIRSGMIRDYRDPRYNNYQTLAGNGNGSLIQRMWWAESAV